MNISLYTFENADGDPIDIDFFELDRAIDYARDNQLIVIEEIYEYTESIPLDRHDYTEPDDRVNEQEAKRNFDANNDTERNGL